ncbi:MAG: squalene/phytoene synthase family protein [Candidatus Eremiobacteraeota bacterium]|nr:squalene/phytoene synthase family protein [Candidatus Eremiobacteraeota bacterium]
MTEQQSADAYCYALATRHYENFTVASAFVRGRLRTDLRRFYAFCRTTDDFGDESGSRESALARLARWRDEVAAFFGGASPVHPVLIALRETVNHYGLGAAPFLDLIAANEQDQRVSTYANWPELHAYCMLSASPVGRVVLRFFGLESPAAVALSDDVCIGLQLANHAQDVRRDAALGRRYLLDEDLAAGDTATAVRALCTRAREMLASGQALEAMAPGALRLQLSLYRLGGLAICDAIERLGFRTDLRRPEVSKRVKAALGVRALFESLRPGWTVRDAASA